MNMNPNRWLELLLCGALAGCSTYEALPLTPAMPAPATLADLRVDAASLPFPALAAHRFDPSDGLDIVETAMLAVANNPDLKLARDDAAIAHAQAYAAGLLPDPQLALSRDLSDSGGADTRAAYSYGLSYDINALLLHSSQRDAAQADAHKTDLNLLWQEWQVVSQARLLFVRVTQSRHLMDTLVETRGLFEDRVRRTQTALARGLLTSDAVSPNVAALQDVQRQVFELERQSAQSARELNALLGLAPSTVLQLQDRAEPVASDGAQIDAALAALPQRHHDVAAVFQPQSRQYRHRARHAPKAPRRIPATLANEPQRYRRHRRRAGSGCAPTSASRCRHRRTADGAGAQRHGLSRRRRRCADLRQRARRLAGQAGRAHQSEAGHVGTARRPANPARRRHDCAAL